MCVSAGAEERRGEKVRKDDFNAMKVLFDR